MASLYASPRVLVLQHKASAMDGVSFPDDPRARADYEHSGWCTFEQACATLSNEDGTKLYRLGEKDKGEHDGFQTVPARERLVVGELTNPNPNPNPSAS